MFDDAVSIFATGTGHSDPAPFVLQVVGHNLYYRDIINVMTIMMKTIKNALHEKSTFVFNKR